MVTAASVSLNETSVKYQTPVQKRLDGNAVSIEAQGTLLAVAHHTNSTTPGGGARGVVTGFSEGSRRRMLRKIARLEPRKITFITLTYPDNFTDDAAAYAHLRALFERFRRRWPTVSAMWRKEYQERGAIHFHLLVFNMPFYHWRKLRSEWAAVVGHHYPATAPYVWIVKVRSKSGAMHYVSKYMSKPQGAVDLPLLDIVTYPHALGPSDPWAAWRPPLSDTENVSRGRFWGLFNAPYLPYAARSCLTIRVNSWRTLHDIKKLMRRQWSGINRARYSGGCLFSKRASALWAACVRLALSGIHDEWFANDLIVIG